MIYLLSPAGYASGGPELMHQLGYKLNLLGYEAYMYYWNKKEDVDPVCDVYKKYHVPYMERVVGTACDVVVMPEVLAYNIKMFEGMKRVLWWLSVDNANCSEDDIAYIRECADIYHLVQSQYAYEYVRDTLKIREDRIFWLSDYLNSEFFVTDYDDNCRDDVVLYNPKKGLSKTLELIAESDYRIRWQALKGLSPAGMREVMRRAKVYIDFGNHPGKDRIPREAAISGCLIVTNRSGSAANSEDVPILDCYKFDNSTTVTEALQVIYDMLDDYSNRRLDYEAYNERTRQEYIEFERDTLRFFEMICGKTSESCDSQDSYITCMLNAIEKGIYDEAYRYLVKYRLDGHEETIVIDVVETVIRIGLEEYNEAQMCALRGIKKDPHNYELYLYLMQISVETGRLNHISDYCEKAMTYSKGTADEEFVRSRCYELLEILKTQTD